MSGAAMSSGTAAKGHSVCAAQAGFRLVMVGAPAGFEPALMAPEAADPTSRICTVYLLVLSCRRPARPRSFRVSSGSWSVQPADSPLMSVSVA
jgi:hypothetical protein